MTKQKISALLSEQEHQKYATKAGLEAHKKIHTINLDTNQGGMDLIERIQSNPEIAKFFHSDARTEVPIAGYIKGKFLSRRIDRMFIDNDTKNIFFLDYKTDTDKNALHDQYTKQIKEYKALLRDAFPDFSVHGYLLWLTDFDIEEIN